MAEVEGKNTIFGVGEDEIGAMYKSLQEVEYVKSLLRQAEEETARKEIKVTREVRPLLNSLRKLRIMFKYAIHWSKPFYPFRLAKNILLSRLYVLLGVDKYVLRGCEFDITFKCNFFCSHCSVARLDESATRKELERKDYKRIVKEAMRLGATSFGFEGGEPFVKKDWDKIIEVCHPKYNHIIISTNGFLLDDARAKRCAELGVSTINLSLDNGIPELHDLFRRKKGSFSRVMNAIKLCKKYKIKVILNTVVHKKNLYTEGLWKILEFGEREGILVNILFAKAVGSFQGDDSMLDDDDFNAYDKIAKRYSCALVHHDTQIAYGARGCNGTKEMLQITPYGDVMNCAHMHIYFGNVKEEPLAEIRKRALKETPFGKYRPCFLALDKDFMNIYYPLLDQKTHVTIGEFRKALEDYEKKHNKVVYPELHKNET